MSFELMFWAMALASITAIFVCGMLLGGWLMRFSTTTSVHATEKTQSLANAEARIEDLTNKIEELEKTQSLANADVRIEDLTNNIEELTAVRPRRNTEIKNHEVLHIAGTGDRFHVKANCPGLNRADPNLKRKLTACRHCVVGQ
jgi:TolA-binding protein